MASQLLRMEHKLMVTLESNSVAIIDTTTDTLFLDIPVGNVPSGVAITPDGTQAYVTNFGDNTISVVDTATYTVTTTVSVGTGPAGIAIGLIQS